MDRRTLLKSAAGAATVGAVTSRVGPLEAVDPIGNAEGAVVSTVTLAVAGGVAISGVTTGYFFGTKLSDYQDAVDAAVENDLVLAHGNAVSANQSYNADIVQVGNTLTRSSTMGHQEARHAIASAWQDGKTASEALSDAHAAIETYYADPVERNWLTVTLQNLAQVAHAKQSGADALVDSGEEDYDRTNPWCGSLLNHPTYGDADWVEIIPADNEFEWTLADGSTFTEATPDMKIEYDSSGVSSGDFETTISMGDWLAGHTDPSTDLSVEIDGESVTWNGNISVPNVSEDGETLPGRVVIKLLDDTVDLRSQIRDQAQTVIDGYSQTLVENLYSALDAGDITPADIRGIDGQAAFMAGTEDASADSYIMSLMQQTGLEQADLSKIASMTVGYRGFVGIAPVTDDSGTRSIYPKESVDSETYRGQLYASSIPSEGLDAGATYAADPPIYYGTTERVGSIGNWDISSQSSAVAVSPSGGALYHGDDSNVVGLDTVSGESEWTYDGQSGIVNSVSVSPDGSLVTVGYDDGAVVGLDASDGSESWMYSAADYIYDVAVSPDSGSVYIAPGTSDGSVYALDAADGSESWAYSGFSGSIETISVAPDNSVIYIAGGNSTIYAVDSSGSENWTKSTSDTSILGSAISHDGSTLYLATNGDRAVALSTSDQSEQWSTDLSGTGLSASLSPDGQRLYVGSSANSDTIFSYNTDDGSQNSTHDVAGSPDSVSVAYNPAVRPDLDVAGTISDGSFYDAENSQYVQLRGGLLTIDQMTGQDGSTVETTSGEDWGEPEYGNPDIDAYIDYLLKSEEFQKTLREHYDTGTSGGSGGFDPDGWLPSVPRDYLIWGAAAIAGLIGISAATS
jgi:hypothetical protein